MDNQRFIGHHICSIYQKDYDAVVKQITTAEQLVAKHQKQVDELRKKLRDMDREYLNHIRENQDW